MAAGDETEVVTDTHVDMKRGIVTLSVDVMIERKDGSIVNIDRRTYEKKYDAPTLDTKSVSDLNTEVKATKTDDAATPK